MKIHSTQQAYTASASTQVSTYTASNVANTQVRRSWRSTVTTESWIKFDCGGAITPAALCLQDVNFTTATVTYSDDDISYSAAGSLTAYKDNGGRYKGTLEFSTPCRYIKVTIPNGTPVDSAAYFSIGTAYLFRTTQEADMPPSAGLDHEVIYPQQRYDLQNGRSVSVELGPQYTMLSGSTPNRQSDDADLLVELARAGSIWIDLDIATNRERQWPVAFYAGRITQSLEDALWPTTFEFKEIV